MRNYLTRLKLHLCVALVVGIPLECSLGLAYDVSQGRVHVEYCISSRMEAQNTQVHPYPAIAFPDDDVDASFIASLGYSTKEV